MSQRVQVGQRFGRWQVVRLSAPRSGRKACVVRCRCGRERVIEERRITAGDSGGCPSPRCRIEADTLRQVIVELERNLEGAQ
jgi:hypothetical protein